MLPDLPRLLAGYELFAQRNRFPPELLRARVVRGAIDFAELRDWFTAHLAPAPRKPWPP